MRGVVWGSSWLAVGSGARVTGLSYRSQPLAHRLVRDAEPCTDVLDDGASASTPAHSSAASTLVRSQGEGPTTRQISCAVRSSAVSAGKGRGTMPGMLSRCVETRSNRTADKLYYVS